MSKVDEMLRYIVAPKEKKEGNLCSAGRTALKQSQLNIIQLPNLSSIQEIVNAFRQQIADIDSRKCTGFVLLSAESVDHCDAGYARAVLGETLRIILLDHDPSYMRIEPPYTDETLNTTIDLKTENDNVFLTGVSSHYDTDHPRYYPHTGIVGVSGTASNLISRVTKSSIRQAAYQRAGYEYPPTTFYLP